MTIELKHEKDKTAKLEDDLFNCKYGKREVDYNLNDVQTSYHELKHSFRFSTFAGLFNGCMYTITLPIVIIALVSIASFFKGFFRKKHKLAFVHNRRYYLLRRILPHYIYLSIMLIFAHFHGQLTDLLLLLITCPVIFWNFIFLLQKRINMNQMDQFGLVTNWIKVFSKQNFNISVIFIIVISIRPLCNALTHILAR